MNWLISANSNIYDHASSFEHYNYIDWRQNNIKYGIGDTVYIYCTRPLMRIMYKCTVMTKDMNFNQIRDDREYWLNFEEYLKSQKGKYMRLELNGKVNNDKLSLAELKQVGLKSAPQGPIKLKDSLVKYINTYFDDYFSTNVFPEVIDEDCNEGLKKTVTVNKYERSSVARQKCIDYYGCSCIVCDTNFKKTYGDIGEGFIHVHHLVPISTIGETYKINYKTDLVPVCPNCHAMLHIKKNDKQLSIKELKSIYIKNSKD